MKKILLSNLLLLFVLGVSAQSFQFMDHNDVDISGGDHYEYGDVSELGLTKFHIKNVSGSTKEFAIKVTLEYVPYTLSDLAICFGTNCFSASALISTTQVVNNGESDENIVPGGIYTELKLAPITWPWVNAATDSCVWVVTVFDAANPNDEVTTRVVWRDNTTLTSVNEINESDVALSAYPNPANNNVTISYSTPQNGELVMFDMVGKEVAKFALNSNKSQMNVDVSSLNAGVYFYSVKINGESIKTERLIIK